jgi:hypothetical protein
LPKTLHSSHAVENHVRQSNPGDAKFQIQGTTCPRNWGPALSRASKRRFRS